MPENIDQVFVDDSNAYNKKIKSIPKQEMNIGIDTKDILIDNIIDAGESSTLNIGELNSFTQISNRREQLYNMLDIMCEDAMIAAVLETYAEDSTEKANNGEIVQIDCSDANIYTYIKYLKDTLNIDKQIYKWAWSLCKYGDIYIRLYRDSDIKDKLFDKNKNTLNEDIKIKAYGKNDKYVHYIEMVANPAEMFELTKYGKTYGFIKADVTSQQSTNLADQYLNGYNYKFNQSDVTIYEATEFVHGCLENNITRNPETVDIFLNNDTDNDTKEQLSYQVKRGQSLLYNTFKNWRELQLLETSVMLNRLTKSSILRIIGVEVGDMPKAKVKQHIMHVKNLIEQKTSISNQVSMSEYNNPGPIENNVYVPTYKGQGVITTQTVGGDVDIKSLADLEYYRDKLFSGLRVPKQYFSFTDDNAGFSGGQSLSIISSRYAKMIKMIQSVLTQVITDIFNLMLIDKGLTNYINKFTIKLTSPASQEELDRQEMLDNKINSAQNILNLTADIDDPTIRLKLLKNVLSDITDSEFIAIVQTEIDKLENENSISIENKSINTADTENDENIEDDNSEKTDKIDVDVNEPEDNLNLPKPDELNLDFTDSENF